MRVTFEERDCMEEEDGAEESIRKVLQRGERIEKGVKGV